MYIIVKKIIDVARFEVIFFGEVFGMTDEELLEWWREMERRRNQEEDNEDDPVANNNDTDSESDGIFIF